MNMQLSEFFQLILFVVILTAITPLLGGFIAQVFTGERTFLSPVLGGLESLIYKVAGVDSRREMNWREYALALFAFNGVGLLIVFGGQLMQGILPLNPNELGAVRWDSALNTAISFITNTNWQSYSGEVTMSYFTQMLFLSVQNFVSAAVGLSVAIALARGVSRSSTTEIGNFWVDLTRGGLYVLLPLSVVFSLLLVSQGVIQNFSANVEATTLEGAKQVLPMGPVASQVAIKMLGTNGGGFFNANAAHPFENSSPLSNFLQMLAIFLIPAALTFTFGRLTRAPRHGWIIFGSMMSLFLIMTGISIWAEHATNPFYGVGALMEGKETRFGVFGSILFSIVTTAASCGAVNAMHASLSPLSGGVAMLNMMLGEVIFGGVGAGLYGMLLFVLLTVFIAGLMVGRTPEYLGKKIEAREIAMVILAVIAPCAVVLIGTAIAAISPWGLAVVMSQGPHGFSEMLYAFTSAAANNGSAFAGLSANTPFYNLMLGLAMLVGRFSIILPILVIAGSLAQKKQTPASLGTFEVDTPLFAGLLIGVILIVGALTFLPALSLGPLMEHFMMIQGQSF